MLLHLPAYPYHTEQNYDKKNLLNLFLSLCIADSRTNEKLILCCCVLNLKMPTHMASRFREAQINPTRAKTEKATESCRISPALRMFSFLSTENRVTVLVYFPPDQSVCGADYFPRSEGYTVGPTSSTSVSSCSPLNLDTSAL